MKKDVLKNPYWENWYFSSTELPLKLLSVAHFNTSVMNTLRAGRPPNGQCTRVFVDKLKAETMAVAKEACRLTMLKNITRFYTNMTVLCVYFCYLQLSSYLYLNGCVTFWKLTSSGVVVLSQV